MCTKCLYHVGTITFQSPIDTKRANSIQTWHRQRYFRVLVVLWFYTTRFAGVFWADHITRGCHCWEWQLRLFKAQFRKIIKRLIFERNIFGTEGAICSCNACFRDLPGISSRCCKKIQQLETVKLSNPVAVRWNIFELCFPCVWISLWEKGTLLKLL